MSKQHTKLTISNRLRRGLAGILSLALLLGLLPAAVVSAEAADHWATPYVQTLTEWGVMRGDISGNLAPERSITRAEFVAMMNRAYGYTRMAGHPFTDVSSRDWYNEDIDIAYNMGYFKGTSPTTASPNSPLTREQAAVLLARNMMLQPTVGETLGFSDSRDLSEWSRGLVGAATGNGIIGGYNDGSFKPQTNITRGEVAAMLVRAIGTPVQEEGDHTLGNVYGNVTVNTPGVKLRDGVITGNLYLTGGVDLGDVLMENITVLGEIVVSGAGESSSAQSSIVLRNVTANSMSVDSIAQQFVTIRAEGNTDIKTTTVRTSAYVDDSALPGYGLWKIIQDGGSLLQLAGSAKEVVNQTPNSELQIVQGTADKITIDEKATNSSVLVDGDARVDDLNLDVATSVTGEGDIKNLDVGAAGSTVEQLPDTITIRPGITADINGSTMNSAQAAEASTDPRLLAGYPKAKNIAPTSATLVFSVNKPGTIYWAVSAVADGSVSEADLIENPAYGGKIVKSGTIKATAANTEYTANLTGLTQDGSYYISAILVDGRDKRSPVKVAAFSTPDGTRPAFTSNPTATLRSTKTAQVTGMPNKSCQLYWALLPEGAAAPTPAQFKANAVTGNVGYGSTDVVKNVSTTVNVNRGNLKEKTNYVAYLWLTDYDGAQSSQVYRVPVYIPDETPPEVHNVRQTNNTANSVDVTFTMNETGRFYWAAVTDEMHDKQTFIDYDSIVGSPAPSTTATTAYLDFNGDEDAELAAKIAVTSGGTGAGAIASGTTNVTSAEAAMRAIIQRLNRDQYNTAIFYLYYVGEDAEGNLTEHIGVKELNIRDEDPPILEEQRFDSYNPTDLEHPLASTGIQLIFSESIRNGPGTSREQRFWDLYQNVKTLVDQGADETETELIAARDALGEALYNCIRLYQGNDLTDVTSDQKPVAGEANVLNYRYATVSRENGTGRMIISFPHEVLVRQNGTTVTVNSASVKSGATYHFEVYNIHDCAAPTANAMQADSSCMKDHIVNEFRVAFAQVILTENGFLPGILYNTAKQERAEGDYSQTDYYFQAQDKTGELYGELVYPSSTSSDYNSEWKDNPPQRKDAWFTVTPVDPQAMQNDADSRYDILLWSDRAMTVSLYSRKTPSSNLTETQQAQQPWVLEGTATFTGNAAAEDGFIYRSLMRDFRQKNSYDRLSEISPNREYAIHIDRLQTAEGVSTSASATWYDTVHIRVSVVAGSTSSLEYMNTGARTLSRYNDALKRNDLSSLGTPDYVEAAREFNPSQAPNIKSVGVENDDTNPVLTVTLDNPGFVNYLIVKVSNMKYSPSGSDTLIDLPLSQRITEGMIKGPAGTPYFIRSYNTTGADVFKTGNTRPGLGEIPNMEDPDQLGLVVASPSPSALTDIKFRGAFQQSSTQKTGGDPQPIVLNQPMEPNSVYLILMAPQGQEGEPASLSDYTYCFRLTTEAATAPTLTLERNSGVDVDAKVSEDAYVRTWLLIQDNLEGETIFTEMLANNLNSDPGYDFSPYATYNVMRSLTATVGDGRSVFDVFASDELKRRMATLITSGNGAEEGFPNYVLYDSWEGSVRAASVTTARFNKVQQDDDTIYFCVGYACNSRSLASAGPWSFSGVSGLTKVVDEQPKVNGISNGLTYTEEENSKDNHIDGFVTISFTTYLYLRDPRYSAGYLPLALTKEKGSSVAGELGTVKGVGDALFVPLMFKEDQLTTGVTPVYADEGSYVRTRSLTFQVKNLKSKTLTIVIPEVFSQFSRSSAGVTTIDIRYVNDGNWDIHVTPTNHLATGYSPNR